MEQQHFSHGLLYSIPPAVLPSLHLLDEAEQNEFEWGENGFGYSGETISHAVFSFLKKTAVAWGLVRH